MSKKILLFTTEMLPGYGYPTAGGGIRAWNIGEGLKSRGYEVIYSLPQPLTQNKEKLPESITKYAHPVDDLNQVINQTNPDVVVCIQWHCANRIKTPITPPLVIDLFGLRVLEDAYLTGFQTEPFSAAKIEALTKADYYICATDTQKAYFLPWLILAGIHPKENCMAAIPVSLSPVLPSLPEQKEPIFVYGGVFWPWQNPFPALNAVLRGLDSQSAGKLKIYGSKHPYWKEFPGPYPDPKTELSSLNRVEFVEQIQHDQLMQEYLKASAAVDLPVENNERFLAFPIRTVCYLWSGLPLLLTRYSPLAHLVEKYDAGWVLNPYDYDAITAVTLDILAHPEKARQKGINAQKLVANELSWDKTIQPLDDFCQAPRKLNKSPHFYTQLCLALVESNKERGRMGAELENVWKMLNQTREELSVTQKNAHDYKADLDALRNKFLYKSYKRIKRLFGLS